MLIDSVDEGGYLRADLAELADRLGCDEAMIASVLTCLQGFEPTGVFARDLSECLALQLKERDRFDPAMAALVDNLELLARRDMAGLKRVCAVDDEDLREMIGELKAQGMTILMATHEMGFARRAADQVCFLDAGQVAESGPPDQVLGDPRSPRLRQFLSRVLNH